MAEGHALAEQCGSAGLWPNGIDWGVVGMAAGVGLVLGLVAGKTASRWLTEVLDWS